MQRNRNRSDRLVAGEHYTIDAETGCWEWLLFRDRFGYGKLMCKREDGRWAPRQAHRRSYEQHVGPIPEGLVLDHLCRNRGCINPAHAEPVTNAENLRRGANARLTWRDVRAIRASSRPQYELAMEYDIDCGQISRIINRRTWWPEPDEHHSLTAELGHAALLAEKAGCSNAADWIRQCLNAMNQ